MSISTKDSGGSGPDDQDGYEKPSKNSKKQTNPPKKKAIRKKPSPGAYPTIDYGLKHDCVIVKLTCGEEILCFVDTKRDLSTNTLRIYYPANYYMTGKGCRVQQWIPIIKNHWCDLQSQHVLCVVDADEEIVDVYCDTINKFIETIESDLDEDDSREDLKEIMHPQNKRGLVDTGRKSTVSKLFMYAYIQTMNDIQKILESNKKTL